MDILSFIQRTHPLKIIIAGLFLASLLTNYAQFRHSKDLAEKLKQAKQPIIIILPESNEPAPRQPLLDPNERVLTRII